MADMTFRQALGLGRPLLLDGAMGTMLQASGLPVGMSPEQFCMESPQVLRGIHKAYLDAGVDLLTTCTFGGNPYKLPKELDVFAFNKRMAEVAREAAHDAGRPVFVAGNVGPSGQFAKPLGPVEPRELIAGFAAQIRGLVAGGADLIFVETQFDLAEARAAVVAARRECDLPVMVSMTFEQGVSLTGSSPAIFAETMQNLGVDVVGTNCSLGPDQMLPVVRELLETCACPVMAEPNAGLPELRGNVTVFPLCRTGRTHSGRLLRHHAPASGGPGPSRARHGLQAFGSGAPGRHLPDKPFTTGAHRRGRSPGDYRRAHQSHRQKSAHPGIAGRPL